MSSETSTSPASAGGGTFQAWHLYLLLGMAAATWAVAESADTRPAALLLLSAAIVCAGLVAIAVHYAVLAFLGEVRLDRNPIDDRARQALETEKVMVLRSLKELEFDRAMRKVGDADYAELNARLRARAVSLMEQLEQGPSQLTTGATGEPLATPGACRSCRTPNDSDARFCKTCGNKLS
jgi:hypothetical protein